MLNHCRVAGADEFGRSRKHRWCAQLLRGQRASLDEFNDEQHRSPLGLPADSDWVLYAPNRFEPVMIHNPFVHQLSRDMGRYSPRTRFVEVYIARNYGAMTFREYQGIYVFEEKIKVG